jgi:glycosyltransferase involved in cell wall biosynthesis
MTAPAPEKLRILAVTNLWPTNGDFRGVFVEEQVDAIRQLGHHVDVEVVAQERGKRDYLLAAGRVRRRVRDGNYDVVHVHFGMTTLAARFVGDVPRVLTLYGGDVNVRWQRWVTRLGLGGVVERIYVSQRMADVVQDTGARVIPNGVDFDVFRPMDQDAARATLGLSVEPDERVVLFGGRPSNPVKGYDVFSEVLATLRAEGWRIRELVLPDPGQTNAEVAIKFAAADAMVFTSRRGTEGSPTVVKEAAAVGLPVVTVDVGDVATVLDGVTPSAVVRFPLPWGTAAARAQLVRELADRTADALRAGNRSNGRERTAWLDSPRIAERVVDVLRSAVRTAARAAPRGGAATAP